MKKIISLAAMLMLILALAVTANAAEVASGFCGGEGDGTNVSWRLEDNGVLTISGTGAMADYTIEDVVAPWFDYYEQIAEAVIEEGVTSIGNCAFLLQTELTTVTFPESLEIIGSEAFYISGLSMEPDIPENVKYIGEKAFVMCTDMTGSLVLPEGIEYLGDMAFGYCDGLTGEVHIPASLAEMEGNPFYCAGGIAGFTVAEENPTYSEYDGVIYTKDGKNLLFGPGGKTGTLSIAEGTEHISEEAFAMCSGLRGDLIIPDSVVTIGGYAFFLTEFDGKIVLGKNVETIGEYAFIGIINATGEIVIPETVRYIGEYAFFSVGVEKYIFEGHAPEVIPADAEEPSFDETDTLYFFIGKFGWDYPEWNGYKTQYLLADFGGRDDIGTEPGTEPSVPEEDESEDETNPNTGAPVPGAGILLLAGAAALLFRRK